MARYHHICHYPKPVPSSTIVNCSCTFLCSQARRMLHHHWLVVDSLQPWLIIGPRSSYRPSRRQLIVSSPQTFLSWIKISPNFFELNKILSNLSSPLIVAKNFYGAGCNLLNESVLKLRWSVSAGHKSAHRNLIVPSQTFSTAETFADAANLWIAARSFTGASFIEP